MTLPADLLEALADVPTDERDALVRVWLALGDAPPAAEGAAAASAAADADAAWAALAARLDAPPTDAPSADAPSADARASDAARRPAARPAAADRAVGRPARRARVLASTLALAAVAVAGLAWLARPVVHRAVPGETLAVTLPDGSAVTLNSGSELRHPRRFGAERAVTLSGEAFFDVAHAAAPFAVETHNARVEVLGTAFNVRAHADEAATAVALVRGRVRVAPEAAAAVELAPGEAVEVRAGAAAAPARADVGRAAAWTRGALALDDRTLGEALAEIERRYGVAFSPEASAPLGARVSAFYAQAPALEALLGDLGAAGGIRFAPVAGGYTVRAAPRPPPPPRTS